MNKITNPFLQLVVVSVLTLFLTACPNVPVKDDINGDKPSTDNTKKNSANTDNNGSNNQSTDNNPSVTTGIEDGTGLTGTVIDNPVCTPDCVYPKDAIYQPSSKLAVKIIYFDYDRSKIKPDFVDTLTQHAIYLTEFPQATIRLEGHSDERGAREYNVALGEQRARAVKRFLQLKGVNDSQISIVSFGEELPASLGHNKESWALNRRVEIVYE